jgi:hypothetical protein
MQHVRTHAIAPLRAANHTVLLRARGTRRGSNVRGAPPGGEAGGAHSGAGAQRAAPRGARLIAAVLDAVMPLLATPPCALPGAALLLVDDVAAVLPQLMPAPRADVHAALCNPAGAVACRIGRALPGACRDAAPCVYARPWILRLCPSILRTTTATSERRCLIAREGAPTLAPSCASMRRRKGARLPGCLTRS